MAKTQSKVTMPNESLSKSSLKYSDHEAIGKKPLHPKIAEMREKETQMVTGVFRCMEPVGGSVSLSYRKYPGEAIKNYVFQDGKTYSIPLGLARHLNSGCAWPVHKNAVDADGSPLQEVGKWIHRFSFTSTEYSDPMTIEMG